MELHLAGLFKPSSAMYMYVDELVLDTPYGYVGIGTNDSYSLVELGNGKQLLFIKLPFLQTVILLNDYYGSMPCFSLGDGCALNIYDNLYSSIIKDKEVFTGSKVDLDTCDECIVETIINALYCVLDTFSIPNQYTDPINEEIAYIEQYMGGVI